MDALVKGLGAAYSVVLIASSRYVFGSLFSGAAVLGAETEAAGRARAATPCVAGDRDRAVLGAVLQLPHHPADRGSDRADLLRAADDRAAGGVAAGREDPAAGDAGAGDRLSRRAGDRAGCGRRGGKYAAP